MFSPEMLKAAQGMMANMSPEARSTGLSGLCIGFWGLRSRV